MEIQRDSITPKAMPYGRRRFNSLFDPYASDSSDSPSSLMKYLRSADSRSDSPTKFITPLAEDDVIVMDGIPVPKSSKGGSEARTRSPLVPISFNSNYGGGRSNSTSPSTAATGIENIKPRKNTPCRFWKACGTCQFGFECQVNFDPTFVHGKEELQRPPRSSGKIKHEIFKSNREGSASPSYGKNYSTTSQAKSPSSEEAFSSPSSSAAMAFSTVPVQVKHLSGSAIRSSTAPKTYQPRSDWSPLDDGIEINLPSAKNPSKEDVDAYIEKVLSVPTSRKRLPVFVEICPE